MAEWLKTKILEDKDGGYFAKGFIGGKGIHNMSFQYCVDCCNVRFINGAMTVRLGFYALSEDPEDLGVTKIQGITSNKNLYAVCDKKFWEIDTDDGTWEERSDDDFPNDVQVNFVNFGRYTICLSGDDFPRVWDRVAEAWTVTDVGQIEDGANPRFGAKFLYGTYVAGSGDFDDILYISGGATSDNPEYSWDWEATGSERKQMPGPIESVVANKERLFIFCDESIEVITAQSLAAVGSVTSTYSTPIAGENRVACHRSVVVADSLIFYLTSNNQIKTISYVAGITEAEVGDLSNREGANIQDFLDSLDPDQSQSFGYYHKELKLVKWHLREKGETINNTILVYDIVNDTFSRDDNKFFSCATKLNGLYYAGSDALPFIYLDENGQDDDGDKIKWFREGAYRSPGAPGSETWYREVGIWGQIDDESSIPVAVNVDDNNEATQSVTGNGITALALGGLPIGYDPIAGGARSIKLTKFEKFISPDDLSAQGKKINVRVSGESIGQDFALSGLSIGYLPMGTTSAADNL